MVPPPSSTFTISMRQDSNSPDNDLGHPTNSDDDFVVIECPKSRSHDSTTDTRSCEPQITASCDTPAESDPTVLDSETTPTENSLNPVPH